MLKERERKAQKNKFHKRAKVEAKVFNDLFLCDDDDLV